MHTLKKLYCRCFQISFRAALPLMPYREPKLIDGFSGVPKVLRKHSITRLLLVTDPGVYSLGLTTPLEQILKKAGITCIVYKDTVANPTSANVEDAKNLYLKKTLSGASRFRRRLFHGLRQRSRCQTRPSKQITGQDGRNPSCHAQAAPADRRSHHSRNRK